VPTYFCAYYSRRTSAWALIAGMAVGSGVAFGLFFGVVNDNPTYGLPGEEDLFVDAGLWGGLAAAAVVAVLTFALPESVQEKGPHFSDGVSRRFGNERLTLDVVNKAMEKTQEPAFTRIGAA
jgi:hypothetical protein